MAAGLATYREATRRMQTSNTEVIGELASLEIAVGEPAAAEQRLRGLLDISPQEMPSCDAPQELTPCIGLLMAINNQERLQEAMEVAIRIQALVNRMRAQGLNMSGSIILLDNYIEHLLNESEAESPEAAAARAIEQGWRAPIPTLRWMLAENVDDATIERIVAMMDDVLKAERARYDLMQQEPPPDLR